MAAPHILAARNTQAAEDQARALEEINARLARIEAALGIAGKPSPAPQAAEQPKVAEAVEAEPPQAVEQPKGKAKK